MRTMIKSFKRLYTAGRITKDYLKSKVEGKTITEKEYTYITGEVYK